MSHSNGSFYSLFLAITWPKVFNRLVLLDPTIKTENYYKHLLEKEKLDINLYKLEQFDQLPDHSKLSCQIIVFIHLNLDTKLLDKDKLLLFDKIKELGKIVNKNVKSRLCLHVDVSHMIHYKIPGVVINSVREIYKL